MIRVAMTQAPLQVLDLPLEDYIVGVLMAEVPSKWPREALKAQAVAARSYAYYRMQHPRSPNYDVEAGVGDLAYRWQSEYPERLIRAVHATRGQMLWWEDKTIPAFFHSCSGGYTEQADRVWAWAKAFPFYKAKPDPFCKKCPDQEWEHTLDKAELTLLLQTQGLAGGVVDKLIPISDDKSSARIHEVVVITDAETIQMPSNRFRGLIGFNLIRSTRFNLLDMTDQLVFLGSGNGHGVGMCQWGAKAMSSTGQNYRQILHFYYPGTAIKKAY